MAEFPRCASCRVGIEPGQNVVFRSDGRVNHVDCPEVVCPVCTRKIFPGDPIRRNGEEMLHGNCWVKRYRAMAGGAADLPWTVIVERRVGAIAHADKSAFREFRAAIHEVLAEARGIRRFSTFVRRGRPPRLDLPLPT
jgi:hypothetical protein